MKIKLSLKNKKLYKIKDVRKWLEECEEILNDKPIPTDIDTVTNAIFQYICDGLLSRPPSTLQGQEFNIKVPFSFYPNPFSRSQ